MTKKYTSYDEEIYVKKETIQRRNIRQQRNMYTIIRHIKNINLYLRCKPNINSYEIPNFH